MGRWLGVCKGGALIALAVFGISWIARLGARHGTAEARRDHPGSGG